MTVGGWIVVCVLVSAVLGPLFERLWIRWARSRPALTNRMRRVFTDESADYRARIDLVVRVPIDEFHTAEGALEDVEVEVVCKANREHWRDQRGGQVHVPASTPWEWTLGDCVLRDGLST